MDKAERLQMSFYDEVYERMVPDDHPLRLLDEVIGWRKFRKTLRKLYRVDGRPAHNGTMMLKLTVLQFLYDLSDRQLEDAARDRISFRWFCRIDPLEEPPGYTSFCRFRERMGPETFKRIFDKIVEQASASGLVVDKLSIVDATDIKAKVDIYKLDSPVRKKQGSGGSGPGSGGTGGPDPDARWGKKSDKKPIHGYKAHAAMDDGSELITEVEVTPANVHDGKAFPLVHDQHAEAVTADKAYDSEENIERIRDAGQSPAIIVKRKRGKKRGHVSARYTNVECQKYYRYKKRRPRVEHKFAEAKRWHGMYQSRYWGIEKVRSQVYLTAIALNLKRMVKLSFGISFSPA